jgi:hypothetical protein
VILAKDPRSAPWTNLATGRQTVPIEAERRRTLGVVMISKRYVPTWTVTRMTLTLGLVIALGLLGAGVYAVFHSTNGAGTAALLTVGALTLFVVVYHDRIRSMEFGGAKMQLALKVKDVLKEAFELRLAGNYEQAERKLEFAFAQFVTLESDRRWEEYQVAEKYQETVRANLEEIVKSGPFKGSVKKTASALSFFPVIDLVMDFDGRSVLAELDALGLTLCPELTEHLKIGELRAGVIIRPGQELNTRDLVGKLLEEVDNGALNLNCFLLIQNCKGSKSAEDFRYRAIESHMHATSLEWEPDSGREKLSNALQQAILTVCNPGRPFVQAMHLGGRA